ncbi:MAG: O-antigen ligase family protein [Mobilitalea sp.]
MIDNTAILQLGIIILSTAYGLILLMQQKDLLPLIMKTPIKWYALYLAWSLIASFFSSNTLYAMVTLIEIFACLLISLALCVRFQDDFEGLILWMCRWGLVIAGVIIFKNTGRNWFDIRDWHDAAVFATASITLLSFYNIKYFKIYFTLMVTLAILSTSLKVYLGFILGIPMAFFLKKLNNRFFALLFLTILFQIVSVMKITPQNFIPVLSQFWDDTMLSTGNGRFIVWPQLLEIAWQSPWIGYGFAMGEKSAYDVIKIYMSSTHNVFLSAFLYSGIPGVTLFTIFIISLSNYVIEHLKNNDFIKWLLSTVFIIAIFISFDQGIGNKAMVSSISQTITICFIVYFIYRNSLQVHQARTSNNDPEIPICANFNRP